MDIYEYLKEISDDKIPKYDVNQYFRNKDEIESLDIDHAVIQIAKDILSNPDNFNTDEITAVLQGVLCVADDIDKIASLINVREDNYLLSTEHLLDMLVLSENRLQELDDTTLGFALNIIINSLIDLMDVLSFSLKNILELKSESKTKN